MKRYWLRWLSQFYICLIFVASSSLGSATELSDTDALKNLKEGKVIWDIGAENPVKLALYLKVVQQTYDGLIKQNVKPDMVFAFHGGAVKLITVEHDHADLEQHNEKAEIATLLADLQKRPGVRMEVCGIATALFKIDNDHILSGIKPVGNTFISLIGYHAQGYTQIPLY
jgi:intracellular sulfur oxidation DsrE/DsrF family protein